MRPLYAASLLIFFSSILLQGSAQSYYPGGLGNTNLFLWLNANKSSSVTIAGGSRVSQWNDLSGNGYNFSQGTAGNMPLYGSNPSGMPGLTFTSTSSQYLSLASLPATISFSSGFTGFNQVSYSATQTTQGWQRIFDFGNGTASDNFMMGRYGNSSNTYYEGWNGGSGDQTWTTSNPIVNGSENLYEVVQKSGTAGTLSAITHYLAGTAQASGGAAGSSTHVPNAIVRTSNYIGRSNWAADNYFSGTMSEILLYNLVFNTTQRVIIENYLAAEWNQAVSVSEYTPPTTTTYTTNLVGIGYTSATDNFTADISGSTDGLGFSSTTTATGFLNTAGYVMAAHNAQSATVITNATVPGINSTSSLTRWNRSWDVQHTGGNASGTITLNFSSQDYNGTNAFNVAGTFALLYNATDGTFATGTNKLISTSASSISTSKISFAVAASSLPTGYYTILYTTTAAILPVTLAGFTATAEGKTALLQWTTTQQTDLSEFTVERSGDGANFSTIGTLAAAGNTSVTEQYSFVDNDPLPGMNYYRLAMVDVGGATTWSTVHSVSFDAGGATALLSVYPNPVVNQLHLMLTSGGEVVIRLLNSRGQLLQTINAAAPATLDIAMSGLAKGIYFLTIDGDQGHMVREIMKE